jgi:hypothetical protein
MMKSCVGSGGVPMEEYKQGHPNYDLPLRTMSNRRANVDREVLMQELEYLRETVVRINAAEGPVAASPATESGEKPLHYCAYNTTRERFLGIDINVADFRTLGLYDDLATLEPRSSMGIWIAPFRGISPERILSPVDLVFLDRNYCVIEIVESYPRSQMFVLRTPADSLLALPVETIRSSGTAIGDQLVLCAPEKMRRRLQVLQKSRIEIPRSENLPLAPVDSSPDETAGRKSLAQVIRWEDHARQNQPNPLAIVEAPAEAAPPSEPEEVAGPPIPVANYSTIPTAIEMPAPLQMPEPEAEISESGKEVARATKNWLQRWLSLGAGEPRKYSRENLPTIVAYFFNGGAPIPCNVGNVSLGGMYIHTTERWYPGTIVRMTLTDRRMPVSDRCITLNGMVVRWDNEGVGVHFVFQKEEKRKQKTPPPNALTADEPLVRVMRSQLKDFVKAIKEDKAPLI